MVAYYGRAQPTNSLRSLSEIMDASKSGEYEMSEVLLPVSCTVCVCVGNSSLAFLLSVFTRHHHMFVIFRLNVYELFVRFGCVGSVARTLRRNR